MGNPLFPRAAVRDFAAGMEAKLRKHDSRGGWSAASDCWLLSRLVIEAGELAEAILQKSSEEIRGEAVDVANFAMMIFDNHQTKRDDNENNGMGRPEAEDIPGSLCAAG